MFSFKILKRQEVGRGDRRIPQDKVHEVLKGNEQFKIYFITLKQANKKHPKQQGNS